MITGAYQLTISTNSYSDEGIHTVDVTSNVDSTKRSASYSSTPLSFLVTVTFCFPSYTVLTMPEDTTYTVSPTLATMTTTQQISVVDANSCGFDSLLINNQLKKTDATAAPALASLTLTTIPSTISICTNVYTNAIYSLIIIGTGNLPNIANTPIGVTSGTWTLTVVSPLLNNCPSTVLIPALIPTTIQLFIGETTSFFFNELTNTVNLLQPLPDCGDLNVEALLNGAPIDWIKVTTTFGSHATGNKVYNVTVDGS